MSTGWFCPGQFVELDRPGKYLRLPISVNDWGENRLTLIYKVVGHGTEQMALLPAGTRLDLLTGLGNGYDTTPSGDTPVLVGGGLPFTSMENLMNENYEDGTYTYEDMTQDGSVLVVDMAFQSLRTNETAQEYAEYAAQFAALDTGEGEPRDVTCFQDEDYTQNLSYPVYIVWYTTGSGEDQREWMVYTVDTDDYTYLYAFGTIADEADDMQDVFYNICDHLELVD